MKTPAEIKPEPVVMVTGRVLDNNRQPVSTEVFYRKITSTTKDGTTRTDPQDGSYKIPLKANEKYIVYQNDTSKFVFSDTIDLTTYNNYQEIIIDDIVSQNKTTQVSNTNKVNLKKVIYYDTDSSIMKNNFSSDLDEVVQLAKKYPDAKIEISGHTDARGSLAYNQALSDRRAKSVYNYLINNNISASRITYKGFGETVPVDNNTTSTGMQNNRRVEVLIIQ